MKTESEFISRYKVDLSRPELEGMAARQYIPLAVAIFDYVNGKFPDLPIPEPKLREFALKHAFCFGVYQDSGKGIMDQEIMRSSLNGVKQMKDQSLVFGKFEDDNREYCVFYDVNAPTPTFKVLHKEKKSVDPGYVFVPFEFTYEPVNSFTIH